MVVAHVVEMLLISEEPSHAVEISFGESPLHVHASIPIMASKNPAHTSTPIRYECTQMYQYLRPAKQMKSGDVLCSVVGTGPRTRIFTHDATDTRQQDAPHSLLQHLHRKIRQKQLLAVHEMLCASRIQLSFCKLRQQFAVPSMSPLHHERNR